MSLNPLQFIIVTWKETLFVQEEYINKLMQEIERSGFSASMFHRFIEILACFQDQKFLEKRFSEDFSWISCINMPPKLNSVLLQLTISRFTVPRLTISDYFYITETKLC